MLSLVPKLQPGNAPVPEADESEYRISNKGFRIMKYGYGVLFHDTNHD